jgi:hypothetical protein
MVWKPCALFLGMRVDMLWTALGLGFQPTHIHLQHGSLGPLVRLLAPLASIVSSFTQEWRVGLLATAFMQGFTHTFQFLFEQAEVILCTNVYKKQQLGCPPLGWHLIGQPSRPPRSQRLVGPVVKDYKAGLFHAGVSILLMSVVHGLKFGACFSF